jgi:hypothetical protein
MVRQMNLPRVAVLLAFFLGGCVSNTPDDLLFNSVQAVDWRSQTEMPGPGASPLRGILSENELGMAGEPIMGGPKPPRLLLKVRFSSSVDIPEFMMKDSVSLTGFAYLCGDADKTDLLASRIIYWQGLRLGSQVVSRHLSRMPPFTYYIYLDAIREPSPKSIPPRKGYDLREQSSDVCFGVKGSSGVLTGYKSNIAIIPKAAIEAAMRDRPEGF